MRRTFWLLCVGTALLAACAVDSAPTSAQEESEITTSPAPAALPPSIVLCGAHDGEACSPPGSHFQCFNSYPLEPGACYCQFDLTLTCG